MKWFREEDGEGRRAVLDIDIDIDLRYGEDASPDCVIIRFPSKRFKVGNRPMTARRNLHRRMSDPAPNESDQAPDVDPDGRVGRASRLSVEQTQHPFSKPNLGQSGAVLGCPRTPRVDP